MPLPHARPHAAHGRRRQPWALVVSAAVLLALAVSSSHGANFKIGVNMPFLTQSLGTSVTQIISFLRMNEGDLSTIDPSGTHTFSLSYYATNQTTMNATLAMQTAISDGVVGVVGDYNSFTTIPAALAGARTFTWVCSGGATSSTLSDKANFPYFFRTISDDPFQGVIIAYLVKHFGWTTANIISSSDAYGQSVGNAFIMTAPTLGITLAGNQVFQPGQTDYTVLLTSILNSGSQIIVLSALAENCLMLLRQARTLGMIGPEWVWIGPEIWATYADLSLQPGDIENVNGMLYVFPREDSYNAKYNASVARWQQAYPGVAPAAYSFLYQDCVTALAKGILTTVNSVGLTNFQNRNYYPNLTAYFLKPFEGVSGAIEYDKRGNRISYFTVFNYYAGVRSVVYEVQPDLSVVAKAPVKFYSGTSVVPRDKPSQVPLVATWSSAAGTALVVLNGIAIAIILAANGYLYLNRDVPSVKNLSFPFLTLICWGCILVLVSNLLNLGVPNSATCQASLWIFVYGLELVLASSAAKAYRLWSIFDNKAMISVSRVGNRSLMLGVASIMLGQTVLLAIWSGAGPQQAALVSQRTYYYYECRSANGSFHIGLSAATIVYNFALLCILTVLAYKTRNISSNFRESSWLFYVSQNTMLCSIVIAMFSFFAFGEATLIAFVIKQIMIIYAVTFAFTALVGRLVFAVYATAARRGGNANNVESIAKASTTSGTGVGTASSAGMKLSMHETNGKVTTVRGVYPVKKNTGIMSTWHSHNVTLHVSDGYLTLIPVNHNPEMGVVLRLSSATFDSNPAGFKFCMEVTAKGKGWIVQFPSEEDREKWTSLIGTIATASSGKRGGSSRQSSVSQATGAALVSPSLGRRGG
ncbi:hypothetical protein H9P43_001066 [Blastocladiella emersonii ATCC 22665]|nr:hypothetical protein H9P43_001066 [Blastocladiella emersonii ATCC 22665]